MTELKSYVVGGAVRDALLGLPVKDRDHVVVGATPEQMLAHGFVAVGKDFPVFLHPQTHEEYALARTERKTAPGYAGFAFHAAADVTLEQDLQRRDLTINAIAQDAEGNLIDPCGGQADLAARVLRHVSPAFVEDPVRILRIARFASRFVEFSVAPETMTLMRQMVSSGEVDALVAERVWQELSRGMMEAMPSRMWVVLRECGALARILPELDALARLSASDLVASASARDHASHADGFTRALHALDHAAAQGLALPARFAVLLPALGHVEIKGVELPEHLAADGRAVALAEGLCKRLRVPHEVRDLVLMMTREYAAVVRTDTTPAAGIVNLFERCDAFRKPARLMALVEACACVHAADTDQSIENFSPHALLQRALAAAQAVNAGAIAAEISRTSLERATEKIPDAIHAARVQAVAQLIPPAGSAASKRTG
jgi:tRNA nucleotidyltransferase (CCA-adding enzyme)